MKNFTVVDKKAKTFKSIETKEIEENYSFANLEAEKEAIQNRIESLEAELAKIEDILAEADKLDFDNFETKEKI